MLRKALRSLAWVAGLLTGIAIALYFIALAVNRQDQPPSSIAMKLSRSFETRPSLADDDNAFIYLFYLFGFDAVLGENPQDVGARRVFWLQSTSGARFDRADDPQTQSLAYASTDPIVARFLNVCGDDSRECAVAFSDGRAVFETWNATHPWLLERYLELIAHSGWREAIFNVSAPFPSYGPAIYGQRLLLLQAKILADSGDTRAASELLARDARFWRMVLASSDLLITKMIATAALRQHFAWGSLVMRGFPSGSVTSEVPDEWRQPVTDAELSLRRVLVGEWVLFANMPAFEYADPAGGETVAARASDWLLRPFFQQQDFLNRRAAYLDELADTLEVPLSGYAGAADRASQLARRTSDEALPPRSLYNVVGSIVMAAGPADYGDYARRVGDLEGMRRAALAAVLLRDGTTPTSQIPAALADSPLRNPYDNEPLGWDAEEQAVVFVGLEPGERGEHRYYF